MAKKSISLKGKTDPAWAEFIIRHFDEFLADHANCERKASALAMSMIVRYPDRTRIIPALIDLAREELEHFEQVYQFMSARGITMIADSPDPYVNQLVKLARHGRHERFLDRLLIASIIESRGAERFRLISESLKDEDLMRFYRDLWAAEAKHGHVFADMALQYFDENTVYSRLHELAEKEAAIIQNLPWRPSLH
ncbi:MAG: tRNA-(ms[2]io[6]A)-hydroxylase [Mariprofundaceae bacterium]